MILSTTGIIDLKVQQQEDHWQVFCTCNALATLKVKDGIYSFSGWKTHNTPCKSKEFITSALIIPKQFTNSLELHYWDWPELEGKLIK